MEEKTIYTAEYREFKFSDLDDLMHNRNLMYGCANADDYKRNINNLLRDLSTSTYYRKLLKEYSAKEVSRLLQKESSRLNIINQQTFERQIALCQENMGNYTIVRVPCETPITIGETTYRGISALKQADKQGEISSRCKRFPCFDSWDYANESRYYRNYWFCKEDSPKWEVIKTLPVGCNECYLSEQLPEEALPMVYYIDDERTMLFAF